MLEEGLDGEENSAGSRATLGDENNALEGADSHSDSGQEKESAECPEERTCGEDCCEVGMLCYAGECFSDCGNGSTGCGDAPGECCKDSEICYLNSCITPGAECNLACPTSPLYLTCGPGEVCDPALERCVPKPEEGAGDSEECFYEPPPGTFDPVPLFTWGKREQLSCREDSDCEKEEVCEDGTCKVTWLHIEPGEDDVPDSVQSVAIPLVIDLDQDCTPEIVFISYRTFSGSTDTFVRAIRGDNGAKVWTLDDPEYSVSTSSSLAAGDIDDDGLPEIIAEGRRGHLIAIDPDGRPLWVSDERVGPWGGGASIVNLDGKGLPEIVHGSNVFDAHGKRIWHGETGIGSGGLARPVSCVADLDGDGRPEIFGGNMAYRFSGDLESGDFEGAVLWENDTVRDGYCGTADFDGDGKPEIVASIWGVTVLSGQDGTVLATSGDLPGGGVGGTPNIDDFNGDGRPDIGVAGATAYSVFDFDPDALELNLLWRAAVEDDSSAATGSTVFDFDGDGIAEVIYNDEHFLRIYPGMEPDCRLDPPGPGCDGIMRDEEILLKEPNSSQTRGEYPVVADVDGDYKAELIFPTNNWTGWSKGGDAGIEVWDDRLGNWVPSRAIWNQNAYHITNVNVDGSIPDIESDNWLSYNNYRSNATSETNRCAPDLVPEGLSVDDDQCSDIIASVWVVNRGCLGVGAGVKVAFFEEELGLIGVAETQSRLYPGAAEKINLEVRGDESGSVGRIPHRIHVAVDDDGLGNGKINECREDNNVTDVLEVCPPGPSIE